MLLKREYSYALVEGRGKELAGFKLVVLLKREYSCAMGEGNRYQYIFSISHSEVFRLVN